MMSDYDNNGYNGWTNYETWNVALWLDNDERSHRAVVLFMGKHGSKPSPYEVFVGRNFKVGDKTGDDVLWNDPALDLKELDEMMREQA